MSPQRWIYFTLVILTGLGLGLLYGWLISPVEYVDTTPNTLRADFRTDFVLMTAETYQSEQDIETAARRLALLGSQPPNETAAQALRFAEQNGYYPADIRLLQDLIAALQVWQPSDTMPTRTTTDTPPAGDAP
jgi:hypothetical protein